MLVRPGAVALALLVVTAHALSAQSPLASIRGLVLDAADAPLAGALVSVTHEKTGERRSVATGLHGEFFVAAVSPGTHRVEVVADGHKRYVRRVELLTGQELRTEVSLEMGAVSEAIEVVGEASTIPRESGAIGQVIDNRLVTELPLDGRNFLDLALLVAGVAPAAPGAAGAVRGDSTFNVSGARDDANAFRLDGVDAIDPKLNTAAVRPPLEAIREFEVRTSSHDASVGRQAGGQVNVVLASGANTLSGTAFEFYRGAFDARNYFALDTEPAPPYERHQFGVSVGGPVVRGRMFFFGDFEGTRRREGITRVTTVPTAAERTGDFSSSLLPPPIDPTTGRPFPGGRIPPFFMHPVGRQIAALYPLPNRSSGGGNYVSSPEERDDADLFDVRVTHGWSASLRSSVRYSFGDRRLFEPFAGPGFSAVPGYGNEVPRRGQNLAVELSHVVSPALTNEIRVGYTRVAAGAFQQAAGGGSNAAVGLPQPWADPRDQGLSFITVTGFTPLGHEYNNPLHGTSNALQVSDVATWARGRHLLKMGGEVRLLRQAAYRDVQSRGLLTFASLPYVTGNALADLLLGYPLFTGLAQIDNPQELGTHAFGAFVQDSFRVNASLTVAAGVRYEYASPPADRDDRAAVYDPVSRALVKVGSNGVPRGGYEPDRNNIAPRVGATWALSGDATRVVHAGYGLYFNQSPLAPSEGLYFSPPYYDFDFYFPLPGLPITVSDPFPSSYPIHFPDSALSFQRDLRTPQLQQWNVGFQQRLGRTVTADVSYVGSRGTLLLSSRDFNQASPSAAPINPRPDPRFSDITIVESRASSRYHSLQASVQRRRPDGLSALVAYTWSTSEDDASGFFSSAGDPNFPQDSNNPGAEWGRSGFDVRHRLSASFVYALPIGRDAPRGSWRAACLADWSVAGIVALQSGRPFTVALLGEIDNSNTGRASLGFGANDRPNVAGNSALDDPTPARWFNTNAFAMPPYGTFGNAGRNILEGPGYANVNLSVLKDVWLSGALRAQLRLETFNLFNRTNFDLPDAFLGSPTFGQILSAQPPRRVQIGARLVF